MKRREFITLLGGAAAAWPLAARAQQAERVRRIGVLLPVTSDDAQYQAWFGAFLQAFGQSGWTIGRNVQVDTLGYGQCRLRPQARDRIGRSCAGRHCVTWRFNGRAVAPGDPHHTDCVRDCS